MKKLIASILLATPLCYADAHITSRTVKYAATLSPAKAVKDSAKGSYFLAKESLKAPYFVVRHPKKDAHGLYKAGKFIF